jgi:hypothetical protein
MISTLTEGWRYAKAVEGDLELSTGLKPEVGFNWHNGQLERVTVTFPQIYEARPLREVAETVRRVVTSQFKQTPGKILLAFSLEKLGSDTAAKLSEGN